MPAITYWADRSLPVSHWPQGDNQSRPLCQFILEIVFSLGKRREEEAQKKTSSPMPVKSLPKISHPF